MKTHRPERGQALVLIVLAIVAIFGFAALAVDGGNVYATRRRAQNAADASALRAAMAAQSGEDWSTTAVTMAEINGFTDDGATTLVEVHHPPISGPYSTSADKDLYYQVIITQQVEPIFAQFIYSGAQKLTVEAVAKHDGFGEPAAGNVIFALSIDGEDAIEFKGTNGIDITGGNIYANGNGKKSGASGNVKVTGGETLISGDFVCAGCNADAENPYDPDDNPMSPYPKDSGDGILPAPIPDIKQPYCPNPANKNIVTKETWGGIDYYYEPASKLFDTTGKGKDKAIHLEPGVHCIDGTIQLSGKDSGIWGENVLIVMLNGGIKDTGGSTMQISSRSDLVDKNGQQNGGLLLYAPLTNTSEIAIGGNSQSTINGTVFLPRMHCDLGGTSDTLESYAAIMCNDFKFHGDIGLNLTYDASKLLRTPRTISLSQ